MDKIADAFSLIRNGANIKQGLDDSGYPITRIETISNRTVDRDKMGYAGITDINSGFFKPVNLVYWEDDNTLNRYKMYPGDLVMSLTGTVGKDDYGNVCILGNDYKSKKIIDWSDFEFAFGQYAKQFAPEDSHLYLECFEHFIVSRDEREWLAP